MRDADNSAILAYLRLRPTEAVATAGEVGSGGAGGTGGTGEDTYRVNRHLRPREEWAATTTVEYTIAVTLTLPLPLALTLTPTPNKAGSKSRGSIEGSYSLLEKPGGPLDMGEIQGRCGGDMGEM